MILPSFTGRSGGTELTFGGRGTHGLTSQQPSDDFPVCLGRLGTNETQSIFMILTAAVTPQIGHWPVFYTVHETIKDDTRIVFYLNLKTTGEVYPFPFSHKPGIAPDDQPS